MSEGVGAGGPAGYVAATRVAYDTVATDYAGLLRDELAGIRGVGVVGADAILLAALGRPAYPVDRIHMDPFCCWRQARAG